jgi:hypothetical protein
MARYINHQIPSDIDDISERLAVNDLHEINNLINDLIASIQTSNPTSASRLDLAQRFELDPSSCAAFLIGLTFQKAKKFVAEFFVRSTIVALLHVHFFDGEIFFGVGSETHRVILETIIGKLNASGTLDCFLFFYFNLIVGRTIR